MAKHHLTHRQSWRTEKIQEERAARAARHESRIAEELEGGDLGPEQTDQVITHFGVQVGVESVDGQVSHCHLRISLPTLVTGDQVVWRAGNQGIGVVVTQLSRRSELCRPDMCGLLKPVATNVNHIVIVFTPHPGPHANLIDRYLIAAEHAGIQPLLPLNKADLVDENNTEGIDMLLNVYRILGHPLVEVSAFNDLAMDKLCGALGTHVSIFVGRSGVSRSSLVNTLLPGIDTHVSDLSTVAGRDTHTTTTVQLSHFPSGDDLIDSPGVREFGLGHVSRDDVGAGFIKFHDLLGHYRFHDYKHDRKPGYALLQALEDGRIIPQRTANYRHILANMPETDCRTSVALDLLQLQAATIVEQVELLLHLVRR